MMKSQNIINRLAGSLTIIMIMSTTSCKKFVEIAPPDNQVELSKIFASDEAAISAAIGLYYRMNNNNLIISTGVESVWRAVFLLIPLSLAYTNSPSAVLSTWSPTASSIAPVFA